MHPTEYRRSAKLSTVHGTELGQRKDGAVDADQGLLHVAMAADADAAFHVAFQGGVDILVLEAHSTQFRQYETDH